MAATAARIAFIQNAFRLSVSEDASVRTNHGTLARESDVIESCFTQVSDGTIMAADRQGLLSDERRLFDVTVPGVSDALALDFTTGELPVFTFVDAERAIDRAMVVVSMTINLATQQTEYRLWG